MQPTEAMRPVYEWAENRGHAEMYYAAGGMWYVLAVIPDTDRHMWISWSDKETLVYDNWEALDQDSPPPCPDSILLGMVWQPDDEHEEVCAILTPRLVGADLHRTLDDMMREASQAETGLDDDNPGGENFATELTRLVMS